MKISNKIPGWGVWRVNDTTPTQYDCIGLVFSHPSKEEAECLLEGVEVVPHPKIITEFDEIDELPPSDSLVNNYVFVKPKRWVRRNYHSPSKEWVSVPDEKIPILSIHKRFLEEGCVS